MTWPLRMVELPTDAQRADGAHDLDLEPGDCYYPPPDAIVPLKDGGRMVWGQRLSDEYESARAAVRPPLLVMLPSGWAFCVDSGITGKTGGWTVTGEPPNITVTPSINCVGSYHGFITAGVLTDDVEGRQYQRQPRADGTGFWWRQVPA